MLLIPERKSIALRLKNPGRVLSTIPTAKSVEAGGKEYVVVPHRIDETRVLRNLGFEIESPIKHYYDWPAKPGIRPFEAQIETAAFLTLNSRAYCLNDMGTGKTLATLWAYDYARSRKRIKKMLVTSPLSTLERTWADEVFQNFPHLSFVVLHHYSRERRLELLAEDHDIYIINHDGLKTKGFVQRMATRPDINLIVPDELASFRNSGTDKWEALNEVINKQFNMERWAWGLTGTPTPNEPTDAWAQCRLITPGSTVKYFGKFRDLVMRQVTAYKWVPRDNALDIVAQAMQPAIRYKRSECVDLPPVVFETRQVELTDDQKKAYRQMLTKLKLEYEHGAIVAANEAVKANKLLQIACGVAYGKEDDEVIIPARPRLQETLEIIESAGAKSIVFVPFRGALEHVAEFLRSHGMTVEIVHGGVSKSKRDEIFRAFQSEADPRVIVAQPGTMSHGLTLVVANTIIWFAPVPSNETFQQAVARISRPGQKLNQLIVMLEGTDVERQMYQKLQRREKFQGTLLNLLKDYK